MDQPNQPNQINIKITDEILEGRYANMMQVMHTKEEFILDFANVVPPPVSAEAWQGIMTARVITSPGHMKRIIKALQENLERYEKSFGNVDEAEAPKGIPFPQV